MAKVEIRESGVSDYAGVTRQRQAKWTYCYRKVDGEIVERWKEATAERPVGTTAERPVDAPQVPLTVQEVPAPEVEAPAVAQVLETIGSDVVILFQGLRIKIPARDPGIQDVYTTFKKERYISHQVENGVRYQLFHVVLRKPNGLRLWKLRAESVEEVEILFVDSVLRKSYKEFDIVVERVFPFMEGLIYFKIPEVRI